MSGVVLWGSPCMSPFETILLTCIIVVASYSEAFVECIGFKK